MLASLIYSGVTPSAPMAMVKKYPLSSTGDNSAAVVLRNIGRLRDGFHTLVNSPMTDELIADLVNKTAFGLAIWAGAKMDTKA